MFILTVITTEDMTTTGVMIIIMIMTEDMTGVMTEITMIEIDIINTRIVTDTADVKILYGGCSGRCSSYKICKKLRFSPKFFV
jgi:hypothetical protein